MAKDIHSFDELTKYINDQVTETLKDEVEKIARRTLKENVITEVYDKYEPQGKFPYQRTGGLVKDVNIDSKMDSDDTLGIQSIREENGKDIAKIIETGEGYTWERSEIYKNPFPRPFHEVTADELREGLAEEAMRKGLSKRGLDIE